MAINDGTFIFATTIPLINPITAQIATPKSMDANKLVPPVANFIVIAPARAATAPTDISKFPDIITKVIPAEIIPIIEDCRKRLSIFCLPKNDGVAILIAIHKAKKPNNTP